MLSFSPDDIGARLAADGATVTTERFGPWTAVVGYRKQFKLSWMATTLHLFTVAVPVDGPITAALLERLSRDSLEFANSRKGTLRGFQSGTAAIPALLGTRLEPDAIEFARTQLVRQFAAVAWPVAVDTLYGAVNSHQGRVAIGGMYAGYLRQQTAVAFGG